MGTEYSATNTIWILMAAALVFFMQAGFAMVATGFTRAKKSGTIIMKNLLNFCICTLLFFLIGFGIMFGAGNGFFGWLDPAIQQSYSEILPTGVPKWVFAIFQTMLCATAATIVSGTMAERTKFTSCCIFSIFIGGIIYPITGHWIWGGGWLSSLGFHDFAGSTTVNMVGGVCALVGATILGPRIGKYEKDGKPKAILGHSLTLGALGVLILWFCWFGFNGGSIASLEGNAIESAGHIFMTTNLSAALATVTATIFTRLRYGKPDISMILNSSLAGLVAITAGCDTVSPIGAIIIGIIAGIVTVLGIDALDKKFHIDDPAGAVGVHCFNGAVGTICVGLFAHEEFGNWGKNAGLFYGGDARLLGVQLLGVICVFAFVAVVTTILFQVLKHTVGLRCSAEEEMRGLDVAAEDAIAGSYADSMPMPLSTGMSDSSVNAETGSVSVEKAVPVEHMPAKSVTSESSVDNKPDRPPLTEIVMFFNQNKFEAMKAAMNEIGVMGMTVTQVMGCGTQKGRTKYYRGVKVNDVNLLPKIKLETVVAAVPVEKVLETAKKVLYTGHIGDGKIFVYDVRDALKVRTGETGYDALQGVD